MLNLKTNLYFYKNNQLFLKKKNKQKINKKTFSLYNFKNKNFKIIFLKNNKKLFKSNKNLCSLTLKYKANFKTILLNRHSIRYFCENSLMPNFSKKTW